MLLEHKLHATRLQSEVSLLTQEKVAAEESVEALLEEISEFEQGVAQLSTIVVAGRLRSTVQPDLRWWEWHGAECRVGRGTRAAEQPMSSAHLV